MGPNRAFTAPGVAHLRSSEVADQLLEAAKNVEWADDYPNRAFAVPGFQNLDQPAEAAEAAESVAEVSQQQSVAVEEDRSAMPEDRPSRLRRLSNTMLTVPLLLGRMAMAPLT